MNVFLIGGPGTISRGTLDALLERGDQPVVLTRHAAAKQAANPDVMFIEGDRRDQAQLSRAFELSRAELVVDTIGFELDEARALHRILKGHIRHLVFLSTVDVFGYPLYRIPMHESDPHGCPTPGYAGKKAEMEAFWLSCFCEEGFPVTIGRPSLSIGPDFCPMMFVDWGFRTVPKIKAGRPILLPGDGLGLMHVGWGYDVGRMVARILGESVALGQVYTLSAEQALSRDDYISLFCRYLGTQPERIYIPQDILDRSPELSEESRIPHLYRYNMAFSLAAFKRDFPDYAWLSLSRGVEEFITVNETRGRFADPNKELPEDRVIHRWQTLLNDWAST